MSTIVVNFGHGLESLNEWIKVVALTLDIESFYLLATIMW